MQMRLASWLLRPPSCVDQPASQGKCNSWKDRKYILIKERLRILPVVADVLGE